MICLQVQTSSTEKSRRCEQNRTCNHTGQNHSDTIQWSTQVNQDAEYVSEPVKHKWEAGVLEHATLASLGGLEHTNLASLGGLEHAA